MALWASWALGVVPKVSAFSKSVILYRWWVGGQRADTDSLRTQIFKN